MCCEDELASISPVCIRLSIYISTIGQMTSYAVLSDQSISSDIVYSAADIPYGIRSRCLGVNPIADRCCNSSSLLLTR